MDIAIYDTEHFETTYALIQIFDTPENKVAIFTTRKMKLVLTEMLKERSSKYVWVICEKSNLRFATSLYRYCRSKSVTNLFLSTVSYHHIYFGVISCFLRGTTSILTIHDANNFFRPKLSLSWRSCMQYIGKKVLYQYVSAFATLLQSTKEYIYKVYEPGKPVFVIPGGVFESEFTNQKQTTPFLTLAVCGSIDEYRRDYEQVIELINELERNLVVCKVILLGAAIGEYGKTVISTCLALKLRYVAILVYTSDFVTVSEYQKQLKECHFVFQPLKKHTRKANRQPEIYGLTTCSGTFFDAIRFGKPLLVPANIYLSAELAKQCVRYFSITELCKFLKTLTRDELDDLQTQAEENSLNFTSAAIRDTLIPLLRH
jgi:glycosyltransferase involved in cell wall biosynthesis